MFLFDRFLLDLHFFPLLSLCLTECWIVYICWWFFMNWNYGFPRNIYCILNIVLLHYSIRFKASLVFCLFPHSIPTRNGANWWVYYCGIVLCFGLGLYHHGSNSKPTHTDYDSIGQSNGSGSLYFLLLRIFRYYSIRPMVKFFFFFLISFFKFVD